MINIEIWASGSGTNADVICQYFHQHPHIQVRSIACNRREAGVFDVSARNDVEAFYLEKSKWNYSDLKQHLAERSIDFIVLAGFLKLVPSEIIELFPGKIINIHPSLLPKYGGKNMYGEHVHNAVLANNETFTGITMHEVNAEFDKGKMLAQYATPLDASDKLSDVKLKIQKLEHTHFAPTIEAWIRAKS
ncbi:MAG: hypothetical protein RLZZ337_942 [Bacteroidota bacterium]|jgi:phosphoribosylglycinamide formyltransferase-1